jgi:hypothetical protein
LIRASGSGAAPVPDHAGAALAAMAEAFERAAAREPAGAPVETYRFGGHPLELRVAGAALRRTMTRAFAHLRVDPTPAPALSVTLWDGPASGVPCPVRYLRDALDRTAPFGPSVIATARDEAIIGYQSHTATMLLDRAGGRLVGWTDAAEALSLFERGKPLQPLLFAWQLDRGVAPVHAGLVARNGRGVLFGGAGGSGKTTTSLTCLAAGFDFLGDDYAGFPPCAEGPPRGFSYYVSSWLEPDHAQRFPWLLSHAKAGTVGDDKLLILASDLPGARCPESAEVAAIALPRVTGRPTTTHRPASMAETIFRLAPSSILQLPFVRGRLALDRLTELAERAPAYWLDLGTDLAGIPAEIDRILANAPARLPARPASIGAGPAPGGAG